MANIFFASEIISFAIIVIENTKTVVWEIFFSLNYCEVYTWLGGIFTKKAKVFMTYKYVVENYTIQGEIFILVLF